MVIFPVFFLCSQVVNRSLSIMWKYLIKKIVHLGIFSFSCSIKGKKERSLKFISAVFKFHLKFNLHIFFGKRFRRITDIWHWNHKSCVWNAHSYFLFSLILGRDSFETVLFHLQMYPFFALMFRWWSHF